MSLTELFLTLLLPAVSMLGIMLFIYDKIKAEPAFLPLITVSITSLIIYFGGMAGFLPQTSTVVTAIGFAALIYSFVRIIKKKLNILPILRSPAIAVFIIICFYFVIQMRGRLVLHVDNFSHWATIIKETCATDAFPVTGSAVTFRNYTPGTASFIYHICNITGFTEGNALMAQGFIVAASLCVIFCKTKWKDYLTVISLAAVLIISVSIPELESASLHYYNFLVDGLIAHFTVAAGIIAYYYRKDLKQCIAVLIPVTSMLTVIKTSARFFALMVAALVLFMFIRKIFTNGCLRKKKTYFSIGGIAGLVACQLAVPSMWNTYVTKAFADSALSDNKFPTTFGGIIDSIAAKDGTYLRNIASMMYEKLTDLSDPVITVFLLSEIFAVCVIILSLVIKERPGAALHTFVCANIAYGLYVIELFIMYGFIFSEEEALILASFYRYIATGVSIAVTLLLAGGVYRISRISKKVPRHVAGALASVIVICFVFTVGESAVQIINHDSKDNVSLRTSERARYAEIYAEMQNYIPRGSSVVVYTSDHSFFAGCLPGYELCTAKYSMMRPDAANNVEYTAKRISGAEYVAVTDSADTFVTLMQESGISVSENLPAAVYKVFHTDDAVTLIPLY